MLSRSFRYDEFHNFRLFRQHLFGTSDFAPELSMGPFRVTQPNPTHYKLKNLDPTQPNTANNGAYSLVVTYFYTQNLSVSGTCQIGRKIKFNCLVKLNLI